MKTLFICTGNICRSPTAHAIARHRAKNLKLEDKFIFDSAGTESHHNGEAPDSRSAEVGEERGISFANIHSRKLKAQDFEEYDLILAMTRTHLKHLLKASPEKHHHKIKLFLEFCESENYWNDEVMDPYYGGSKGFEEVFDVIELAMESFFKKLAE